MQEPWHGAGDYAAMENALNLTQRKLYETESAHVDALTELRHEKCKTVTLETHNKELTEHSKELTEALQEMSAVVAELTSTDLDNLTDVRENLLEAEIAEKDAHIHNLEKKAVDMARWLSNKRRVNRLLTTENKKIKVCSGILLSDSYCFSARQHLHPRSGN